MSDSPEKNYEKNPFAIPEPYYLPGYTGHCPSYQDVIGQTYGRATHSVLENLPSPPARLKPLTSILQNAAEDEDLELISERKQDRKTILSTDIAPGYKGHIPRASYLIGMNFNQSCIRGLAEFEKKQKRLQELLSQSLPRNNG
ncbi:protein FAM166B-like [Stegodyphus dumicola]|uniref:protein FAM166B-like n=1 Tax=Stegodyphus dumicola TaxID=202533 RepID=UPI0015AE8B0E|nr:protein FAM166B-like [Stegodyphus dumicola]